jgi:hypothetical protein
VRRAFVAPRGADVPPFPGERRYGASTTLVRALISRIPRFAGTLRGEIIAAFARAIAVWWRKEVLSGASTVPHLLGWR